MISLIGMAYKTVNSCKRGKCILSLVLKRVLNRGCCPTQVGFLEYFFLKQGQDFNPDKS